MCRRTDPNRDQVHNSTQRHPFTNGYLFLFCIKTSAEMDTAPNPRHHQLRLIWNGLSKVDLDAIYQEALVAERLGRLDEAEKKFRDTLAGFENLLSSTNLDIKAIAYRLASFYAKNDRMKDADAVFDWVTGDLALRPAEDKGPFRSLYRLDKVVRQGRAVSSRR